MCPDQNNPHTAIAPDEREKWEVEKAFKERDFVLKERDQYFREEELDIKKKEQAASGWKNPLVVAIMAASVAALGNALITLTNAKLQRELEDQKSEQARILEMIKTGDPEKAAENLKFLLDAGLIASPSISEKLSDYLIKRKPGSGPTLPSPSHFEGNPLSKRIDALKNSNAQRSKLSDDGFSIQNHILLDRDGTPVSNVDAPISGKKLIALKAIVLHFSATDSEQATFKWLENSSAVGSTHLVIDRNGKVTQLVPFDLVSFHAGKSSWNGLTSLNQYSIGLDFVNAGQLRRDGGTWFSLSGKGYSSSDIFEYTDPKTGEVSAWHKYSDQQIRAVERVIKALVSNYPSIEAVVGHSDISPGRKFDPGPALPIGIFQSILINMHTKSSLTDQSSVPTDVGR